MEIEKLTGKQILDLVGDAPTVHQCLISYTHRNPLVRWLIWRRYSAIADIAGFRRGMDVLEFGCGLGVFLPTIARMANRVYAADLMPDGAIRLCQKLDLDVRFVEDVSELAGESLDVIIAADVLEHLEELDDYVEIFVNKLKPGGRLIISGPTENLAYRVGRFLAGVFGQKPDPHLRDIYGLKTSILRHGFSLGGSRKLPFGFPPFLFLVYEFLKPA